MENKEILESGQYLTFTLGEEEFALEIAKVREVLDYTNVTKVPRAPVYMQGVINLRGNVVPIIDLRLTLGMSAIEKAVDTCIIIAEVTIDGDIIQMGALADSVQEVVDIDPGNISPPPTLGTKLNTDFIKGMGKRGEEFLIILDIDKVLASSDLAAVASAVQNAEGRKQSVDTKAEDNLEKEEAPDELIPA
ncbi:MAG: chemotaxis protein CheW [Candidatus Zixiibacteriota bacterium]